MGHRRPGLELPAAARWAVYGLVAVCFVAVVALRGGPAVADAADVVMPTSALSHGQLADAAGHPGNPNPPGYELFAAAVVAALRPLVGASDWCVRTPLGCQSSPLDAPGNSRAPGPWYRSQAAVACLAWLVLEISLVALFAALGRGGTVLEALCLLLVALSPAAADAVVGYFHPQDLLCTGLVLLALAAALRQRWVLAGAALGAACTCKQFALLALLPVVLAAPDRRKRVTVVGTTGAVAAVVVAPFFVADPSATVHSLAATGILRSPHGLTRTVVGSLPGDSLPYAVARYGPLLALTAVCVAARRLGHDLRTPVALVGLVLACLATRLVFEQAAFRYYLLAVSVVLVCLDAARSAWPVRSAAWVGLTSLWWQGGLVPASTADAFTPVVLLLAAGAAVWIGLDAGRAPATSAALRKASA